jgi:taurine dioxygenase
MSAASAPTSLKIRSLGATLGADVEAVDLAELDDETFAAIEKAWAGHLVLRFRHQRLSDVDLMNFSRRLGVLDRAPIRAAGHEFMDDPRIAIAADAAEYVIVISNVKIGNKAIGNLGNYESHWHTDMSYNEVPPMASALYAIEVPPTGGDTSFANMYTAYESLDTAMRHKADGLVCIHDASRNSVGELRRGFCNVSDPLKTVGAHHPLVRTHPVTRRKALFLGRRRGAYIPGLSPDDSEALLDRLWEHATKPEFCWTQVWQPGDLVLWDNRCTLHRRDAFDDHFHRIMHRTQISSSDKPY